MRNTTPITSTPMFNNISITITSHPLSSPHDRAFFIPSSFVTRHALRMSIANIVTAKNIALEITNIVISSLSIFIPVLSVSPS
jgi:hypothetical protein